MRGFLLMLLGLVLPPSLGQTTALAAAPAMVIAPHIAGEAFCDAAIADPAIRTDEQAWALCAARGQTSAARLSAFLDTLGPRLSPSGHYALGYTLTIPVLGIYTRADGGWRIDPRRVRSYVSLISAIDRPVVIYLSANHFTDAAMELSKQLAGDPRNLMWTRLGPMRSGGYFMVDLLAWTLADMQAPVTRMREDAFRAVLDAICALPAEARARIAGVNVLGEVHQLFAGFPDGMDRDSIAEASDYSAASVTGFRAYLAGAFPDIAAFNAATGLHARDFGTIEPPGAGLAPPGQLRGAAAGTLTLQGWAYTDDHARLTVSAWLDGGKRDESPVWFDRLDVTDAIPGLPSPNLGWRLSIDDSALPPGPHTIDVLVTAPGHSAVRIARRHILVRGRAAGESPPNAPPGPPNGLDAPAVTAWPGLHATIDSPGDGAIVVFDPLARLWQRYREQQVRGYITHFADIVGGSCLGGNAAFSHEINARLNSNWNTDVLAVSGAEAPSASYRPGTTLYGGAAFGDAFFAMAKALGWREYAVTEMHPLFGLSVPEMEAMLARHMRAGARYVEPYYMTIKPPGLETVSSTLTRRMLRPGNPVQGSGNFYAAIQDIMANK